jgi:hypothetical protein
MYAKWLGPGEAVAGHVGDGGIQHRQRAVVGILRQQPDYELGWTTVLGR